MSKLKEKKLLALSFGFFTASIASAFDSNYKQCAYELKFYNTLELLSWSVLCFGSFFLANNIATQPFERVSAAGIMGVFVVLTRLSLYLPFQTTAIKFCVPKIYIVLDYIFIVAFNGTIAFVLLLSVIISVYEKIKESKKQYL